MSKCVFVQGAFGVHADWLGTHKKKAGYRSSMMSQYAFVIPVEAVLTDTFHVRASTAVHVHCGAWMALLWLTVP